MGTCEINAQEKPAGGHTTSCALCVPTGRLRPEEVHVWWSPLAPLLKQRRLLEPYLSADEAARQARFRFPRDGDHYLLRRGLLRVLLGRYLHTPPADVRLTYGAHGKPMLAQSDLCFNMSESRGCAIYAITRGRSIGVDIEQIRDAPALDQLARQHFADAEYALVHACSKHAELRHTFFWCWTRKEAFVKALGEGLHHPLETFDTSAHYVRSARGDMTSVAWSLHNVPTAPGFAAALAIEGNHPLRVQVRRLAYDDERLTGKEPSPEA
jgi:4'-phosphopantetheinyl transferase